jgi:hypothetical protein
MLNSRRHSDAAEITAAVERFDRPLTSTGQILRAGLVLALLMLLGTETWLLWHAWSLWG